MAHAGSEGFPEKPMAYGDLGTTHDHRSLADTPESAATGAVRTTAPDGSGMNRRAQGVSPVDKVA